MPKHILFTIHGIQRRISLDHWQDRFHKWVHVNVPAFRYIPYRYGFWFGIVPYLATFHQFKTVAFLRRFFIRGFLRKLRKVQERNPGAKLHIVAHSFGSWVVHEALYDCGVPIETLHLVGSVVSSHIERNYLDFLLELGDVKRIYIWSSKDDEVVQYVPPPFGHLGYWGLIDSKVTADRDKPRRQPYYWLKAFNYPVRFKNNRLGGHSEYFTDKMFSQIIKDSLGE